VAKGVTPIGRVSYPHVFEAKLFKGKTNFSMTLLFDESADLSEMKKIAEQVAKEKWPNKLPEDFRSPFRNASNEPKKVAKSPEYAGHTWVQFKAKEDRRPQVVGPNKKEITQKSGDFYPGCYARVSFNCYAYDVDGSCGVNFGLNNVQKARDGERLDSGSDAESDFDAMEDEGASDLF